MDEKWRSIAAVEYAIELVPNAQLKRFEENGHCPTVEEPNRFSRIVNDCSHSVK